MDDVCNCLYVSCLMNRNVKKSNEVKRMMKDIQYSIDEYKVKHRKM